MTLKDEMAKDAFEPRGDQASGTGLFADALGNTVPVTIGEPGTGKSLVLTNLLLAYRGAQDGDTVH